MKVHTYILFARENDGQLGPCRATRPTDAVDEGGAPERMIYLHGAEPSSLDLLLRPCLLPPPQCSLLNPCVPRSDFCFFLGLSPVCMPSPFLSCVSSSPCSSLAPVMVALFDLSRDVSLCFHHYMVFFHRFLPRCFPSFRGFSSWPLLRCSALI